MRNFHDEAMQNYPFSDVITLSRWERTSVSDIATEVTPGFASGQHNSQGTGIPHLRPMNIDRDGQIDLNVVKSITSGKDMELTEGDVLFNNTNSAELVGKTALISKLEKGFAFSNHMTKISLEHGVNPHFIARQLHYLWMCGYMKQRCTNHVNQASISSKTLANTVPILVPPSMEQDRIVAKLEELLSDLDAGVTELKSAQKKLTQYRQSLLKAAVDGSLTAKWRSKHPVKETGAQLLERILIERRSRWEAAQLAKFKALGKTPPKDWQKKCPEPSQPGTTNLPDLPEGWVWASVEQVASDERYSLSIGPFGSNLKVSDYESSGVPLVFVRNIRSGIYGGEQTKYVTPSKAVELAAHSISSNDVLVTKMGDPPGDADVYPEGFPTAIITADCIKIRCQDGLMRPRFLKAVINSYIGRMQIEPITQGVAQKKVSLGRFVHIAVPVPPAMEQKVIEDVLEAKHSEIATQQCTLEQAASLSAAQRQNILRSAFSGKLVPQDPNDEPASKLLERIRTEREERSNHPKKRTPSKRSEIAAMMKDLEQVLTEAGDWLPAQEAFKRCGIADGVDTDEIERIYAQLRKLDKANRLQSEAVNDSQGRKLYDRIRLVKE